MKQLGKRALIAEIERVNAIIETTKSTYLRRDMQKYVKRLEKQLRYGRYQGPRTPQ